MTEIKLPNQWVPTKLGELCILLNGFAFKSKDYLKKGDFVIRIGNVQDGKIVLNNPAYINSSTLGLERFKLRAGDLLMSLTGNVGRVGIISEKQLPAVLNQRVAKIQPHSRSFISDKWLFYLLQVPEFKENLVKTAKGAAQLNISGKDVLGQQISFPPLTEQKQIAAKLDELLAQVDTIKTRLDTIPVILKRFRQSVLAAAVSGRLTEEWRDSQSLESIDVMLDRIRSERVEMKSRRVLNRSFGKHNDVTPLFKDVPKSWRWVTFEAICENKNNALKAGPFGSALKKSDCAESGYRVYGQEQVIANDESLVTYYVNKDKFSELQACRVKPGDILVSLVGTIGKVLVLSELSEAGIINPRLVKLSLAREIQREYIRHYLGSPVAFDFFQGFSHGGTMEILNLGILKKLPIPLPSIEEQIEVVRRVEQLFAFSDQIEQRVKDAQTRVNHLTQSILAKAFRGELTAEWREQNSDLISGENSAEALLERIKAEQANTAPKKRTRKK